MKQLDFRFKKDIFEHELFQEIQPHIVKKFKRYHYDNPHVYPLFKRFSADALSAGRERFGCRAIMERVRWFTDIETKGDAFKMNNNYNSCYARLLMIENPKYQSLFKRRTTT